LDMRFLLIFLTKAVTIRSRAGIIGISRKVSQTVVHEQETGPSAASTICQGLLFEAGNLLDAPGVTTALEWSRQPEFDHAVDQPFAE